MKQQYWVSLINGTPVNVIDKPDNRMATIKKCITGTDVDINDEILRFIKHGGSCELSSTTSLVETDKDGALEIINTSICFNKIKIRNLKQLKKKMEEQ